MHEMGIMSAMLRSIDSIVDKEEENAVITKIVMQIGEISGVVPRYIEECYKAVVGGTRYENTKLIIEVIPGIVYCNDCEKEFNAMQYDLHCPLCNGKNLKPVSGMDLLIKEIEIGPGDEAS